MSFLKKWSFGLCVTAGEGCALALTALLLLPAAWAVSAQALPLQAGLPLPYIAAGLAVLAPTAAIGRVRGRQALAMGGAIAGGYILLAALVCALGGAKCAFGPWLGILAAAVGAGALAGALLSVRQNRHKRRRR